MQKTKDLHSSAAWKASSPLLRIYGPQVGAIALYLVQQQLLPLGRACEVMEDLLAVHMSEGTVGELIKRCTQALAPVEQQIKEALIQSEVIHQDETGLSVQTSPRPSGSSKLLMNRMGEFIFCSQRGGGGRLEVSEQVVPLRERVCNGPQKSPNLVTRCLRSTVRPFGSR
jgi:hypothetical protein